MLNCGTVCPLHSDMCNVFLSLKVCVTAVGGRDGQSAKRKNDPMDIFFPSSLPYLYVYTLFIRPQRKTLYHPSLISYCAIMLLSVLFFKLSLGNFLSQQRETQAHGASEQGASPRQQSELGTQNVICEWPSVQSGVTMWLIDENLHCLYSRSQRSRRTKRVLSRCPASRHSFCCLKVMLGGGFINR